jgi:hypothetical protein
VNAFSSFSSDSTTGIEMLNRAVDIHLSSVTLTCALPIHVEHSDSTGDLHSVNNLVFAGHQLQR